MSDDRSPIPRRGATLIGAALISSHCAVVDLVDDLAGHVGEDAEVRDPTARAPGATDSGGPGLVRDCAGIAPDLWVICEARRVSPGAWGTLEVA